MSQRILVDGARFSQFFCAADNVISWAKVKRGAFLLGTIFIFSSANRTEFTVLFRDERGLHGALAALCTSKYFQNPKMRPAEPLDPTFRFSGGIQFVPVLLICLYGGWYAGDTGKSGSLLNPGLYSATFRRQTLEEKVCFT